MFLFIYIFIFLGTFVGVALGAKNWVRISIGTEESELAETFDRLKSFYSRHAISKETIKSHVDTVNQIVVAVV